MSTTAIVGVVVVLVLATVLVGVGLLRDGSRQMDADIDRTLGRPPENVERTERIAQLIAYHAIYSWTVPDQFVTAEFRCSGCEWTGPTRLGYGRHIAELLAHIDSTDRRIVAQLRGLERHTDDRY
ncbi:hypothetical protein [Mycolicibacterium mucogenicum]|nr:hypothetical protein [Mycolicibacterium mucogenicum]QPG69116.1 hypothetical protein C1S78_027645 [Mycolicibacterium mucogenicum DSM 44124]